MGKVRVEEVKRRRRRRRTRRVRRQVEPGKFFVETIPISAPTYFLQHTTQPCTTNNSEYIGTSKEYHLKHLFTKNLQIKLACWNFLLTPGIFDEYIVP